MQAIIDIEVDYAEKRNGRVIERGKITLPRGEELELRRIIRDSHGTLDLVILDGGDEIEVYQIPRHYLIG